MLIYYFLYLSLSFSAALEIFNRNFRRSNSVEKISLSFFYINFIFMFFITCFRFETGIDYYLYEDIFIETPYFLSIEQLYNQHDIEYGFLILISIFKIFSDDFNIFIIFISLIIFFFMFIGIAFNRKYANLQLLIIGGFFLLYYALGMQRQAIAMVIFFASFKYLLMRKKYRFYFFCIIGLLFHKVMILSILTYIFLEYKLSKKSMIIMLSLSFLFSYFGLMKNTVDFLYEHFNYLNIIRRIYYYYYVLPDRDTPSIISYLHRIILIIIIFLYYNRIDYKYSTLILCSPFFYFIFSDIGLLSGRIGGYFLITYPLYFGILFNYLEKEKSRWMALFLLIYIIIYGLVNYSKILFLAVNHLNQQYYIPYKSIFQLF